MSADPGLLAHYTGWYRRQMAGGTRAQLGLAAEVEVAASEYILARTRHIVLRSKGFDEQMLEADRARTAAHNRVIDALRILARNVVRLTGSTLPEQFHPLVGDATSKPYRQFVAEAALDWCTVDATLDSSGYHRLLELLEGESTKEKLQRARPWILAG